MLKRSPVLPCKMSSGSVRVSFSPPSGTRHTRIFASSPARVMRSARQTTRSAANTHSRPTQGFTYPQQAAVCQKGPMRSRPHLQNSGWWAGPSLAVGQAESAGSEEKNTHTVLSVHSQQGAKTAFDVISCSYLEDSNLAAGDGKGHCHALAVDTEAIALPWGGQVEATQVRDVCVPVHHRTLDVTELGGWAWIKK